MGFRLCGCEGYVSTCEICGGWDKSANRERACRMCRRLFKRKEREIWRARKEVAAWSLETSRQVEQLREGKATLRLLHRAISNPEALASLRAGFARARTSQT